MSSGVCQTSSSLVLTLLWKIVWLAFLGLNASDVQSTFKRISDRICAASINLVNHKLIVISAYAPTLEVSEANPELQEHFSTINSTVPETLFRRMLVPSLTSVSLSCTYQCYPLPTIVHWCPHLPHVLLVRVCMTIYTSSSLSLWVSSRGS